MKNIILVLLTAYILICTPAQATTTVHYNNTGSPVSVTNGYGLKTSINNFRYSSPYKQYPVRYPRPYYNRPYHHNYYHRPVYGYPHNNYYRPYYGYNPYPYMHSYIPPYNPYYYYPGKLERTLYRKALARYNADMLSYQRHKTQPLSRFNKNFRISPPRQTAYCNGIRYYGGSHSCW